MPSRRRCKSNERRNSAGQCVDRKRSIAAKKAWKSRSRSRSKSYKMSGPCKLSEIRNELGYCVDRKRSFSAKRAWRGRHTQEQRELYGICRTNFPSAYPNRYSVYKGGRVASPSVAAVNTPPSYASLFTPSAPSPSTSPSPVRDPSVMSQLG